MKTKITFILLLFSVSVTAQKLDMLLLSNARYVVFTSSEEEKAAADHSFEQEPEGITYHMFMLTLYNVTRMMTFFSYDNVPPIVRPKSFLDSIQYMDWDVYSADSTLTQKKADQMIAEFEKDYFDGRLIYFIDRRDFTADSIQLIGVRMFVLKY